MVCNYKIGHYWEKGLGSSPRVSFHSLIYSRATFMEIFFNIFIWFWFSYLWNLAWCLVLVTFRYFFFSVKSEWSGMLASRLWKSLLFLTHSSWALSVSSYRHLNLILIHFYWFSLLESVLKFSPLLSRVLEKPVTWLCCNSTDVLWHDVGFGCGGISERIKYARVLWGLTGRSPERTV